MSAGVRVHWHGQQIARIERQAALRGLELSMDLFFDRTQTAVPEDTGRLRASARVEIKAGELRGELHYGEGVEYAAIVHEKTEIDHPNGQAKYLEIPMRAYAHAAGSIVAAQLRARLM